MNEWLIILLGIGMITIILGVLVAWKKRKEGKSKETDYRAFFIMGISFLPLGIVMTITIGNPGMLGLTALGIIYMIMGLANRDKWKKKS
ncbi:MAG: hypothetical protein AVW05_04670 [Hadesarchaea archaeon DG-33]|nr:MAG: hypothetical protein AVW05_04670 [Hadesarchaea archaeon DG-33]